MSARFLVTCWPFEGHVFPQMSIAAALRDRGHEVAFYSAEQARPVVESEGFELFPFEHVDEAHYLRVHASEETTGGRRQSMKIQHDALRNWLVESIPGQLQDLRGLMARWHPDVLVSDLAMWAPITILWESVPIPVALSSTFMGPLVPGRDAPAWGFGLKPPRTSTQRLAARVVTRATELVGTGLRRRVDGFRRLHGLPPLGCSINEFTGRLPLYLVGSLPELDYGRRDVPPCVHYVGACTWHPPEPPGTAAWLSGVPSTRPWVHVTEGTSHHQEPFLLRNAVRGLADAPVEVVLTTGRQRDPGALLGPLPPNVHATRWLSHGELLPRCAAVVTTGGPATIMAALQAGVPLVVVPTTWDKPDNARRVMEAGVGVRLKPGGCSPRTLRAAIEAVLGDSAYRTNARRVAERLAAAPGPAGAAELLEELVPARVTVPAERGRIK
jgi:UDP:flavonoid glycosyltransferase YjiC (YdhE family)